MTELDNTQETQVKNSTRQTLRGQLLQGVRTVPKASFRPFSAFSDSSCDELRRGVALPPLVLALLAYCLITMSIFNCVLVPQVNSGEIELPQGLTWELYLAIYSWILPMMSLFSVMLTWLSTAAVTYFLCRLFGHEIPFPPLLTLTAFVLLPDFWIVMPIAGLLWYDAGLVLTVAANLSLPISIAVILWRTTIQSNVIGCFSDIGFRRSFLISLLGQIAILMVLGLPLSSPGATGI
ncbi:MAG: YIP1 family protein [Candidatus Thorarchaeota archaeon]|nr:YIP1 family protein [Candidatus Thorarchaeota archaeon]